MCKYCTSVQVVPERTENIAHNIIGVTAYRRLRASKMLLIHTDITFYKFIGCACKSMTCYSYVYFRFCFCCLTVYVLTLYRKGITWYARWLNLKYMDVILYGQQYSCRPASVVCWTTIYDMVNVLIFLLTALLDDIVLHDVRIV